MRTFTDQLAALAIDKRERGALRAIHGLRYQWLYSLPLMAATRAHAGPDDLPRLPVSASGRWWRLLFLRGHLVRLRPPVCEARDRAVSPRRRGGLFGPARYALRAMQSPQADSPPRRASTCRRTSGIIGMVNPQLSIAATPALTNALANVSGVRFAQPILSADRLDGWIAGRS
jgi:hypothetical protein